jgi:galactokinase
MFVYAPKDPQKVVEAINNVGGKSYIIEIDKGTVEVNS